MELRIVIIVLCCVSNMFISNDVFMCFCVVYREKYQALLLRNDRITEKKNKKRHCQIVWVVRHWLA
jgi:hypothetical protein